jgi:type VI protein secretion system component VasK
VPAVTFNIDGQPGTFSRTVTPRRVFRWLGPEAREVKLSAQLGGREEDLRHYFGTWAVFKLFQEGTWRTSGTLHVVQWSLPFQDQTVMLEAEVDLGETPPILDRNYFRGIRSCVSRIVR